MTGIFVNSKFDYRNSCLQQVREANSNRESGYQEIRMQDIREPGHQDK